MIAYIKKFVSMPNRAVIGRNILATQNDVTALVTTAVLAPNARTLRGKSSVLITNMAGDIIAEIELNKVTDAKINQENEVIS